MKIRFMFVALLFALYLPALADEGVAGICGGVTFYDDPDLSFRTYVIEPNPAAHTDMSAPASFLDVLNEACLKVELSWSAVDGTNEKHTFACAVIVAGPKPDCVPTAAAPLRFSNGKAVHQ